MFGKILIANRGEIALRVARTCREMGIKTVAVYSTADRDSAVVRAADQAIHIGPAAAKHSYLNAPAVIEAALQAGAEAIHPGYGFLSEDADFAEICRRNGLVFIGPPPEVLHRMADKASARTMMQEAGLPVLPGGRISRPTAQDVRALADEVGYPLIIKASAGGGGRGMAVVRHPGELLAAYRSTRATAMAIFGDGGLYIERYIEGARHIEVQVLCDDHGNTVALGDRDCSVQRRHQKLLEEAPAGGLPDGMAQEMADSAVRGARATGFRGAGTFEFLVDADRRFTFMEINCRIQVEHPVTEAITGLDIVREQLRVAAGLPLDLDALSMPRRGVALEARLNAEDPDRGFAPTAGLLTEFVPAGGPFTRVDSHAYPGYRVAPDYDSLLAKVVVWAPDREQAIARLDRALAEFRVDGPGVRTTGNFLRQVLRDPRFQAARHTTALVAEILAERTATAT
jgi:acetyl-CoA carboxylase biotin carboxylase subunit